MIAQSANTLLSSPVAGTSLGALVGAAVAVGAAVGAGVAVGALVGAGVAVGSVDGDGDAVGSSSFSSYISSSVAPLTPVVGIVTTARA